MATGGKRPGSPKSGGRAKGTPNKRTRELMAILDENGYCPIAELIEVAALARKEYERAEEIFDAIQDRRADLHLVPLSESSAPTYLQIMQKSAAEIAPYLFPKRKAIEHSLDEGALTTFADMVKNAVDAKRKANPSS